EYACYAIWIAMVFDFLDGFVARILKVHSAIGKELDSLADMVTFGFLPSVFIYQLLDATSELFWIPYIAFSIAIFSALRLAKFNIDERQQSTFIGLPTPANALFVSSLYFVFARFPELHTAPLLIGITVLFSLLMVSPLELFALKFKDFGFKGNEVRYLFLAVSLVLIVVLNLLALPAIILIYLLLSLIIKALKLT
ncbi:MAG: CDP-diacylglycerol--serine O-phosphatidyltransferase, partial [Bacteroidota bacterium]